MTVYDSNLPHDKVTNPIIPTNVSEIALIHDMGEILVLVALGVLCPLCPLFLFHSGGMHAWTVPCDQGLWRISSIHC
jgi:hypothetical protein